MSKFERAIKALFYANLVISSLIQISECSKKPAGVARKEDIPFIKCQVCELLAHQLYQQVQAKQSEISPKQISEYQIIEISENVCNLKKQESDWILKIDIVEQGDRLELVEQETEGHCNSECKTIERACQQVLGYSDTDVAEYIFKKKPQIDSLMKFLCKDLTGACNKESPKVPKNRVPGDTFIPKSSKEAEMDKIMKSMEGMPGAPGMKMYSKDDLKNMKNFGDENADDDDEDDEDESEFPAKLGKVIKDQESKKIDWSQRIMKGIVDTCYTLKNHANKVSNKIISWWNQKKQLLKQKKNSKNNNAEL